MDWMQIINAHVMWKQRLLACIEGRSEEKLDPEVICRDDQCALGKWIYGEGKQFESLDEYDVVREQHAHFHLSAAEVVKLAQSGNANSASTLLNGEYSRISERLKHKLIRLQLQVNTG
jgi:Chemoreceptor zinc-binding domain